MRKTTPVLERIWAKVETGAKAFTAYFTMAAIATLVAYSLGLEIETFSLCAGILVSWSAERIIADRSDS